MCLWVVILSEQPLSFSSFLRTWDFDFPSPVVSFATGSNTRPKLDIVTLLLNSWRGIPFYPVKHTNCFVVQVPFAQSHTHSQRAFNCACTLSITHIHTHRLEPMGTTSASCPWESGIEPPTFQLAYNPLCHLNSSHAKHLSTLRQQI